MKGVICGTAYKKYVNIRTPYHSAWAQDVLELRSWRAQQITLFFYLNHEKKIESKSMKIQSETNFITDYSFVEDDAEGCFNIRQAQFLFWCQIQSSFHSDQCQIDVQTENNRNILYKNLMRRYSHNHIDIQWLHFPIPQLMLRIIEYIQTGTLHMLYVVYEHVRRTMNFLSEFLTNFFHFVGCRSFDLNFIREIWFWKAQKNAIWFYVELTNFQHVQHSLPFSSHMQLWPMLMNIIKHSCKEYCVRNT